MVVLTIREKQRESRESFKDPKIRMGESPDSDKASGGASDHGHDDNFAIDDDEGEEDQF